MIKAAKRKNVAVTDVMESRGGGKTSSELLSSAAEVTSNPDELLEKSYSRPDNDNGFHW